MLRSTPSKRCLRDKSEKEQRKGGTNCKKMKECGLLPHWNIQDGVCDLAVFDEFAGSPEEDKAWNRYLEQHVPLNTGSYGLLSRGMYELQLRPWLKKCPQESFLVLTIESLRNLEHTMPIVWKHLGLPAVTLEDDAPKNTRDYNPSLQSSAKDASAAFKREYLQAFFAPYNRRLAHLQKERGWEVHKWSYVFDDGENLAIEQNISTEEPVCS